VKTSRLFIAFVAAALLGGGAAAFLVASAVRARPWFPPVGEGQPAGVKDRLGRPILSFAHLRGQSFAVLHDPTKSIFRAVFSLDSVGRPEAALLDPEGDTAAVLRISGPEDRSYLTLGPDKRLLLFAVAGGKAGGALAATRAADKAGFAMGFTDDAAAPYFALRGPNRKSAFRVDFAADGTPRITFADRGGNARLALDASTPTRKDRP
jgi:hypothetical protein